MDYARRRKLVFDQLAHGVLVLPTNREKNRSNDTDYRFRPSSDLLYLCGFAEPEAILVLAPHHPTEKVVLFVLPKDPEREIWDGFRHGPEGAVASFGADAAYPISEFDARITDYLAGTEALHYALGGDTAFDARMLRALSRLRASRKAPDRAPKAIVDPRPMLHRMRMVKDADEIRVMARSAEIAAAAHLEAMRATRPGMNEFEIDALIEYAFRRQGAEGPAYTSIVAGGANACCLHYNANNQPLEDGDLLLVDAGCEWSWYAADITRTWPVGRRFSGPQRDIYSLVLEAELAAIEMARPGISNQALQQATVRTLTQGLVDLKLLHGEVDGLIESEAFKRFYMHGVGHYLGLDVHDVGVYYAAPDVGHPMPAGAVITIEPGIYIAADDLEVPEAFRGIGVRIEDDVVLTEDGPVVLTGGVPKTIADIESIREEALG